AVEGDLGAVFVLDAVGEHLELELTDHTADRILLAPGLREELHRAFARELGDALLELLALERIEELDAPEVLRAEAGQGGEAHRPLGRERVADAEDARIEEADDVARVGLHD